MRLEYILWQDCVSIDAWTEERDLEAELHSIETIGMFVKETDTVVVLALNRDDSQKSYSCVMNIPKVNIVTRRILKVITED